MTARPRTVLVVDDHPMFRDGLVSLVDSLEWTDVVGEAEDALDGLSGTFGSIQPPGERADQLRDELAVLLSDALDHTTQVRIAVRRGTVQGLGQVAEPLDGDAQALRRFLKEHGG